MHDRLTLRPIRSGPYREHDPAVIKPYGGLRLFFPNREQVAPSPEVVALTLDELPRCFSRLPTEFRLLSTDPTELGHCIGKWMGVRMAAGVLAVSELIHVGSQLMRFTRRSVTTSAMPIPTELL